MLKKTNNPLIFITLPSNDPRMDVTGNYLENEYATFWIEGGIVFFTYKPNTVIDLHAAQKAITDRIEFQQKKAYPILYDIRGIVDTDKAGRDYMARRGYALTKAVGFLVHPPVNKGLIQYFLEIHKPYAPSRLFTTREQAIEFLEQFA